jgi:MoxR-like ATPase
LLDRAVIGSALADAQYLAGDSLQTALFLAMRMGRPLFLEGEPGTGKTALAVAIAKVLGTDLVRLQCYEGLELSQSAYEWNVARQLMEIRLAESGKQDVSAKDLYRRELLLERPLLRAISQSQQVVLLIDEIDRADEAFDAFLLEMLAENQITIPELGTIRAVVPPLVLLTSNRTRQVHDALRRRCLYHWLDYPDAERELEIVRVKVPGIDAVLAAQVVKVIHRIRMLDVAKAPGVAEAIDWARALTLLGSKQLDRVLLLETLGVILKHQDDLRMVQRDDLLQQTLLQADMVARDF